MITIKQSLKPSFDTSLLERAARAALDQQSAHGDLTIVLTDDNKLHELNRDYLGVDAPTDVLSFPVGEVDPESEALYLGDILISYPRALAQAEAAGQPVQAELRLLVVHGTLHLLGYDHAEEDEQALMWKAQDEILARLG